MDKNVEFHEMILKERSSRRRHTQIYKTDISKILGYFKQCHEEKEQHVFQIPFHLKDAAVDYEKWENVEHPN